MTIMFPKCYPWIIPVLSFSPDEWLAQSDGQRHRQFYAWFSSSRKLLHQHQGRHDERAPWGTPPRWELTLSVTAVRIQTLYYVETDRLPTSWVCFSVIIPSCQYRNSCCKDQMIVIWCYLSLSWESMYLKKETFFMLKQVPEVYFMSVTV